MNRDRFKFRVWDGEKKTYAHEGHIVTQLGLVGTYDPFVGLIRSINCTIEQCTGLTDKNGKLIYEGDVVRVEDECGICDPMMNCDTGIGVITWECEMWYIDRNVNLGLYDTKQVNYIEIIGNIHEDQFRNATKKMEENR